MHGGGFVLAGGRSRRMGRDKALLAWGGRTLIERVAEEVAGTMGSVTLIGSPARYGDFGWPAIDDLRPGLGPLGGVETALTHTHFDWNLIVACDLAGARAPLFFRLLAEAGSNPDSDVILAVDGQGQIQPLCAVYHRRALATVRSQLDSCHLKLLQTIALLRTSILPIPEAELCNLNSPADWENWLGTHV